MSDTFSKHNISHLHVCWLQSKLFQIMQCTRGERCPGKHHFIWYTLFRSTNSIWFNNTGHNSTLSGQTEVVGFNWLNVFWIGLHNHLCPLDGTMGCSDLKQQGTNKPFGSAKITMVKTNYLSLIDFNHVELQLIS